MRRGALHFLGKAWQAAVAVGRERYLTAAGLACVAAGAFLRWHVAPRIAESSIRMDGTLIVGTSATTVELGFRALTLAAALIIAQEIFFCSRVPRRARRVALILAALLCTFPSWMNQWGSGMNDAQLLDRQMSAVIEEMETTFTEQQVQWREWQSFSPTIAGDGAPLLGMETVSWGLQLLTPVGWGSTILDPLGLPNAFLAFMHRGYPATIAGALMVAMGLFLRREWRGRTTAREVALAMVCGLVSLSIPLGARSVGEKFMTWGDDAQARGEHTEAIRCWRLAGSWKPRMKGAGYFYDRIGRAALVLGRENCVESQVALARTALGNGKFGEAIVKLRRAIAFDSADPHLRIFLAAALNMRAATAFNSGQYALALDAWREALTYHPSNPLFWYGLSMTHLRLKHFEEAVRCRRHVAQLHKFQGFRSLTVRSQEIVLESWAAFHRRDNERAHTLYTSALQPDTW